MISIRDLTVFRTVCEEGSFTKAAEKLYMTQPAVSHVIRDLEEIAGAPLFDRFSRKIRLNETGKLFLENAAQLLNMYDSFTKQAGALAGKAVLRLGSSITVANFQLPGLLKRFSSIWPDTPVQVRVDSAANITESLCAHEVDLALIEGLITRPKLTALPFTSYRLAAAAAPGYRKPPLALTLSELTREKLLLREKGSAIRDTLDSAMLLQNVYASPSWESANSQVLLQAAKAGLGVTVLPLELLKPEIEAGRLVLLELTDIVLKNDAHIVYHREKLLSPPMQSLISLIEPES